MFRKICLVAVLGMFATAATAAEEGFVDLFNGEDLTGWETKDDVWSVKDGMLIGRSPDPKLDHNSFITTKKEYGDFELRIEFRMVGGKGNSGVQYRSKRVANSHEVSGYQADLGKGWWGALYDEARRRRILQRPVDPAALKKVLKPDGWNEYRIIAKGNHLQQFINGVKTVDYIEKDADIRRKGCIAPQVHSGARFEMRFRNIRIKEL